METEVKPVVTELTTEQKAELALKQLQAENMAKIQNLTNDLVKLLNENGCELIVEHNIRVVPKKR